jgi:hypothetical protein
MELSRRGLLKAGMAGVAVTTSGCTGDTGTDGTQTGTTTDSGTTTSGSETTPGSETTTTVGPCPVTQTDCEAQIVGGGSDITEDTTWGPSQGCWKYETGGNVNVTEGATLTIEAGTLVRFKDGTDITVHGDSAIVAEGTERCPIQFKGTAETAGHWDGIDLKTNSDNENNSFNYCDIAHGSKNLEILENAKASVENCTFRDSSSPGIIVTNGARFVSFSSNMFSNNEAAALRVPAPVLDSLDSASTYDDGNTHNRVDVRNETITEDGTWADLGVPMHFSQNGNIEATVTIEAGATVQIGDSNEFKINEGGALDANGESGNEVTIQGANDQKGYWEGMKVASAQSANQLTHTTVRNGGARWDANVILTEGGRMGFDTVTFEQSADYGLIAETGTEILSFSTNTFQDNDAAGLKVPATMIPTLDSGSTYAGNNGDDRIELLNEEVEESATWKPLGVHFHFTQNVNISNSLTINPDTVLEFASSTKFSIIGDDGKIDAVGDKQNDEPIVFRGSESTKGHWHEIRVKTDASNVFQDCEMSDAENMVIVDTDANATVTNCTISNVSGTGLFEKRGASLSDSQNTFSNVDGQLVKVTGEDD